MKLYPIPQFRRLPEDRELCGCRIREGPPCWPAEPLPCGRTGSLSERDDKTALPEKRIADGYAHTTIAFAVADEVVTIR
jgi:hypothetical protein